uniref:Sushi domain-containing protein n=1 Tax=Salarias fasciatus TaxID=181472 RepID=A0A672ITN6_SALFA
LIMSLTEWIFFSNKYRNKMSSATVICSNQRDQFVSYWGVYYWQQKKLGDTASYACRRGYKSTNGATQATCTRNGWTPKPLCHAAVDCGSPPPLDNGDTTETLKNRYSHDERVEFRCQNYHVMEGEPFKTCISGEWSGDMKCLSNRFPTKMYLSHNDEVAFICARGRHGNALEMRQRCVDGVLHLPSCR